MAVMPPRPSKDESWLDQIDEWHLRLAKELPEIEPHELRLMIRSILQPPNVPRRWLLRKTKDGRYVL